MAVGIAEVRKEKAGFLKKVFNPVVVKEKFTADIDVIVAELSFTAEEIGRMPSVFRNALRAYVCGFLRKCGAEESFFTKAAAKAFDIECGKNDCVYPVSQSRFAECVSFALNRMDEAVKDTAYIKDSKMSAADYSLLKTVAQRFRYIVLLTDNTGSAEELAEQMYDEYGVYPEIRDCSSRIPSTSAFAADVDRGTVRLGLDCIIDGLEPELDLRGYEVDKAAVLACMGEKKESLAVKFWLSGKKRLTR